MEKHFMAEAGPKFYGATTIGERGQVVIPAEARKDFQISPSTKLLVFSGHGGDALMLVKAEFVTEFLTRATKMLSGLEEVLKADADNSQQGQTDQP